MNCLCSCCNTTPNHSAVIIAEFNPRGSNLTSTGVAIPTNIINVTASAVTYVVGDAADYNRLTDLHYIHGD